MKPVANSPFSLLKSWRYLALLALLLIVGAIITFTSKLGAWGGGQWAIREQITIDPTAGGITDTIGTTPVLLRLHDGNFSFAGAKEDGSDLRFVASDNKTELPYQIERYDSLLGEAFVWVQARDLKPGAPTTFWLYYGNDKAQAPAAAKRPYDADTVLVYHFDDHGQAPADASGLGNNGDKPGVTVPGSFIGGGLKLNGQSTISIPASASLEWVSGGTMTWSAWVKPSALQPNAVIFSRRDGASDFVVGMDNGIPFADLGGQRSAAGTPVAVNTWHHLAVVVGAGKATLYLDGEVYASWAAALPALNNPSQIGGDTAGGAGFTGELDELEISRVPRSPGAIKLAALQQGGEKAEKFLVIATGETAGSGGGSNLYMEILKNVTIDGWIVILILVGLGIWSARVALEKWQYLKKNKEANARFMQAWRQVSSDLTVLDHGDSEKVRTLGGRLGASDLEGFRDSSIYRLYHIGAEEVRHRLTTFHNGDARILSAQSIQAIRASLDTGLVNESERFNARLNTLVNSISGGPFIGLAGTVAGVTITFASIAAAGEVNVNAIAPGISAALVATLAGLFLAIPATFVYNALSARIEGATNELQVFTDEYVAKLAEFYRPRRVQRGQGTSVSDIDHLLDGLSQLIETSRSNH